MENKPNKPESYLVWGILATILCCLPFGIVSIVYAAKVDGLYNSGDFEGAEAASKKAKTWAIAAAVTGVVVGLLYFLFVGGMVASGLMG
ncbi:CD225/dispanin family protein [Flavobacterium sp.]|uniref:CD225/dispanin family protein n=1 Tax=Flavobacterium sp. TaxID=239 RepID=UPI002FDB5A27